MARIAFLSTAHIHTKAFIEILASTNDGREAAVIWDDVSERGQRYAEMAGCPFEPDMDKVLADASIDGFIICCENTRHLPLLRSTLPVGKPVFCEKPLVTSTRELTDLRELVAAYPQTVLFGGYFQFYDAALQSAKELILSGGLGKVTRASYRNAHHAAYGRWFDSPDLAWFANPALAGGGGFFDMGTHAFHALRSIFGQAESVWADIGNESGEYPACDDYGVAHLKFGGGVKATVEAGWTFTGGRLGLEVIGSEKSLWHDGEKYVVAKAREKPEPLELTMPARPFRVERMLAVIRGELSHDELYWDLEASMDIVAWMEAAYTSAGSGRWESIG
ncbi:Gfo/Idh/MocA family protein [Synoicihabitans lomoniglobus]|uniref:Gfo/Idh/MocA family oxidoreductase n=1 Tax=Synoicihabitans lomoniglobus TaxID=2909285 RepID=A0AAE9ZYH5_9BACT|nr:Gfo/Idh/MocA family oxidoreductase [Opitutaceae bacterium LMO-M01]WED65549.1 Gfo/Idh/MocA family oxidoreductase [Opitutaceae bacterium LMO-M01]